MQASEITIGKTYTAKVTNTVVPVRIDAANPGGGWDGTNLTTGKKVRIKSAGRLRGEFQKKPGKPKAAKRSTSKPPATKARSKRTAPKKQSLLDHAAAILAKAKEPMNCRDLAKAAQAAGWKSSGKTPHATLYAAIIREISSKGGESRFEKVDRGHFRIRKGK